MLLFNLKIDKTNTSITTDMELVEILDTGAEIANV